MCRDKLSREEKQLLKQLQEEQTDFAPRERLGVEVMSEGPSEDHDVDGDERAVYIISVAAELAGVHPQTLRIYERKGLLQPEADAGNTRRYSDADIEQLRRSRRSPDEGVNLAGVKTHHGDAGGDRAAPAPAWRSSRRRCDATVAPSR